MTSPSEPRELFPLVLFAGRPPLAGVMRDFRATPMSVDDAMPPRPATAEVEPDPKFDSSATGNVTPSEPSSSETQTPTQTITPVESTSPSGSGENPASAGKDSPLMNRPRM